MEGGDNDVVLILSRFSYILVLAWRWPSEELELPNPDPEGLPDCCVSYGADEVPDIVGGPMAWDILALEGPCGRAEAFHRNGMGSVYAEAGVVCRYHSGRALSVKTHGRVTAGAAKVPTSVRP